MFQGLRTVIYHVDDIEQAKAWYSSVLGFAHTSMSRSTSALMLEVSS